MLRHYEIDSEVVMVGLFQKYIITKADGSPVDPEAIYIVLRIDEGDRHARAAVERYAMSLVADEPEFSLDLRNMLRLQSWEKFDSWKKSQVEGARADDL